MHNRQRNEHAKLWKMETVAAGAPWLMASTDAMNSRHCFLKRWHVADIKNIVGDDQATPMVDRNSTNIVHTLRFYVCLRLRDRDCCSAADSNGSRHGLAPSFFEEMTRCRRQKHCRGWPGNPNGRSKLHKYRAYLVILRLFMSMRSWPLLHGWQQRQFSCHRVTVVFRRDDTLPTSKHHRRWTGNPNGLSKFCKYRTYIPILRLFTSTRSWPLLCSWWQRQLPRTRVVVFLRTDTSPMSKHHRWWPGSIEIWQLPKFMPTR